MMVLLVVFFKPPNMRYPKHDTPNEVMMFERSFRSWEVNHAYGPQVAATGMPGPYNYLADVVFGVYPFVFVLFFLGGNFFFFFGGGGDHFWEGPFFWRGPLVVFFLFWGGVPSLCPRHCQKKR